MSALSEYVNRWLRQEGKGQNELADLAKVRRSTLSHLMNKKDPLPRPSTVKKLAGAMKVNPATLTFLLGYPVDPADDPDGRAKQIARQLDAFPWLAERFDDLMSLPEEEFREMMDYLEFRRRQRSQDGDQSSP